MPKLSDVRQKERLQFLNAQIVKLDKRIAEQPNDSRVVAWKNRIDECRQSIANITQSGDEHQQAEESVELELVPDESVE